jgi:hypothetical protein
VNLQAATKGGKYMKCVIIGSFKKHYSDMVSLIESLHKQGIVVSSPQKSWIVDEAQDFVMLASDTQNKDIPPTIHYIESRVLKCIDESSFVYLYNPEGYVGVSTAFELGYAVSKNIPVYSYMNPSDPMVMEFINKVMHPNALGEELIK